MPKAPEKEPLTIPGPIGAIEALLETPESAVADRLAVLCHPHPQFQGTMHNKVVHTLARAMNDLQIPALRFNFRGVGSSEGSYGEGHGEVQDVYAVVEYVSQRWPSASIWLGGFSFGAVVSARAAVQVAPERLVSIAPAVNVLGKELQSIPTMPWLIVQGDTDDVVPEPEVTAWVKTLEPSPDYVVLPGVGHFFHGHLVDLRTLLTERLSK
ncbi:MAG: alpha/beta hydrolase [Gammaproteobacteria bacterium]